MSDSGSSCTPPALATPAVSDQQVIDFDGASFERRVDGDRLRKQLNEVLKYLLAHEGWHTLAALHEALGYPEASISARLRDLRKPKFGGYEIARRRAYAGSGTWQYRLALRLS
jgi:biotin operon repressor